MSIGFLITARLKSSRLPLKLLLDLNGQTVVERVIERCKRTTDISEIILCTSTNPQDNPLVNIATRNGISYFRGDEFDVLKRLSDASKEYELDYIINITGENPLFSIQHANMVVEQAKKGRHDFIYVEGLPIGCAVYGIKPEALKTVCAFKQEIDTEIWGPLINRPEIFDVKKIEVVKELQMPDIRLTIDYPEDFLLINNIFSFFLLDYIPSYEEILEVLNQNQDLLNINSMHTQMALGNETVERINKFFENNEIEIQAIKRKYYKND